MLTLFPLYYFFVTYLLVQWTEFQKCIQRYAFPLVCFLQNVFFMQRCRRSNRSLRGFNSYKKYCSTRFNDGFRFARIAIMQEYFLSMFHFSMHSFYESDVFFIMFSDYSSSSRIFHLLNICTEYLVDKKVMSMYNLKLFDYSSWKFLLFITSAEKISLLLDKFRGLL